MTIVSIVFKPIHNPTHVFLPNCLNALDLLHIYLDQIVIFDLPDCRLNFYLVKIHRFMNRISGYRLVAFSKTVKRMSLVY